MIDLVFMIDRGTGVADDVEQSLRAARSANAGASGAATTVKHAPADESAAATAGRSEAEQELLKALRAKRSAG